jgi:hypothetical protein
MQESLVVHRPPHLGQVLADPDQGCLTVPLSHTKQVLARGVLLVSGRGWSVLAPGPSVMSILLIATSAPRFAVRPSGPG